MMNQQTNRPRITILVAMAENGVIGREGEMPWKLSSDLARFKLETMGKPVIMGRKTFESIGRPLPGRRNIVVTRNALWGHEGVETATSLDVALAATREADEICVIGGGEIYAQAIDTADCLKVTHVLASPDGDTFFPPIDPEHWQLLASRDVTAGPRDSHPTRYAIYGRREK